MKEFVDKDGYICFRDKGKVYPKHRLLYQEYHNCVLDKNETIIFLDGNKRNFNIENLEKLKRSELVVLNRWFRVSDDPNETKVYIDIIRLKQKRIEYAELLGLTDANGNIKEDALIRTKEYYKRHPDKYEERKKRMRDWASERRKNPVWLENYNKKRQEWRKKCGKH